MKIYVITATEPFYDVEQVYLNEHEAKRYVASNPSCVLHERTVSAGLKDIYFKAQIASLGLLPHSNLTLKIDPVDLRKLGQHVCREVVVTIHLQAREEKTR